MATSTAERPSACPHRPPVAVGGRPATLRHLLLVPAALTVVLALIFLDLWRSGPISALDVSVAHWDGVDGWPALRGPASVLDKMGLRGVTVPLLLAAALWLRWRTGRWRPLGVVLFSVLAVNGTVGVLKLVTGRGHPSDHAPELFVGDIMWPSGHAANVAMTAALVLYLGRRYGGWRIPLAVRIAAVAVPSVLMTVVSVFLGYHWLSDLLAGTLLGLLVVAVVSRLENDLPRRYPALSRWCEADRDAPATQRIAVGTP